MSEYTVKIKLTVIETADDGSKKQIMKEGVRYDHMDYSNLVAVEQCVKGLSDSLYGLGLAKLEQKKSGK